MVWQNDRWVPDDGPGLQPHTGFWQNLVRRMQDTNTGMNLGQPKQGDWGKLAQNDQWSPTATGNTNVNEQGGGRGPRFLEEWAYGGDQLGGGTWDGKAWQPGKPVGAGTFLKDLGITKDGAYWLPTSYDSRLDTGRYELNGQQVETAWSRVLRKAQDAVADQGLDWETAFKNALNLVNQEAAAQGKTTGFGKEWAKKPEAAAAAAPPTPGATAPPPVTPPGTPAAPDGKETPKVNVIDAGNGGGNTPGVTDPKYNMLLMGDKAARTAALLQRLGLGDPMRQRSVYGQAVGGQLTQLLDPWMKTQGLGGGNVADNFSDLIDKYTGYFNQGGGGMGAIANDARSGLGTVMGDSKFGALDDDEHIAMIQTLNELADLPKNSWLRKALGNIMDDSVGQFYAGVDQRARAGQDPAGFRYLPFIKGDPRYAFMTGR